MKIAIVQAVCYSDNVEYFRLSMLSCVSQSLKPTDYVLVCDGPVTEGHNSVIEAICSRCCSIRFSIIRLTECRGLAFSMNKAIKYVDADYYVRMDSDDISCHTRIERQVSYLSKNPHVDMVGSFIREVDEAGRLSSEFVTFPITHYDCLSYFQKRNPFAHPTITFASSFFTKIGSGYNENLRYDQDRELWSRAFLCGCELANLPIVLLHYRRDASFFKRRSTFSRSFGRLKNKFYINIRLKFGILSYLYAILNFLFEFMPTPIKKVIYSHRNSF